MLLVILVGRDPTWPPCFRRLGRPFFCAYVRLRWRFLGILFDMSEATTADDYAKILAGAKMYLEVFRDRPDKTGEFVDNLRSRLGWSPSGIMALQVQVADILLVHGMTEPIIQDARVS